MSHPRGPGRPGGRARDPAPGVVVARVSRSGVLQARAGATSEAHGVPVGGGEPCGSDRTPRAGLLLPADCRLDRGQPSIFLEQGGSTSIVEPRMAMATIVATVPTGPRPLHGCVVTAGGRAAGSVRAIPAPREGPHRTAHGPVAIGSVAKSAKTLRRARPKGCREPTCWSAPSSHPGLYPRARVSLGRCGRSGDKVRPQDFHSGTRRAPRPRGLGTQAKDPESSAGSGPP